MGSVLVGRDAERRALLRLLDAPAGARPPVVLVAGEAGAGKTALVEHVLAGRDVRRGRAGEWRAAAHDVLAQAGFRAGVASLAAGDRETEVMELVARGCTSREIGTELFLSPRTVEMHVRNCLLKLGCRTRAEAVRRLAELGLT